MESISVFRDIQNLLISGKKCWCQENSRGLSSDSYSFYIFFRRGITVSSLIIAGYVWQILGRGWGSFVPHTWAALKKPILNRVKYRDSNNLYRWAMSRIYNLPVDGFKRVEKTSQFNESFITYYNEDSERMFSWSYCSIYKMFKITWPSQWFINFI